MCLSLKKGNWDGRPKASKREWVQRRAASSSPSQGKRGGEVETGGGEKRKEIVYVKIIKGARMSVECAFTEKGKNREVFRERERQKGKNKGNGGSERTVLSFAKEQRTFSRNGKGGGLAGQVNVHGKGLRKGGEKRDLGPPWWQTLGKAMGGKTRGTVRMWSAISEDGLEN